MSISRRRASLMQTMGERSGRWRQILAASRNAKDLEEAVRLSESVLELDPKDKDTSNVLAIAKFKLGERGEAEALLSDLLASGQAPITAVINASLMRLYQRDIQGCAWNPGQTGSQISTVDRVGTGDGKIGHSAGDRSLAEAEFQRATRIAPQDPRAWSGLGSFYAQTSQPEKALAAFEAAGKIPNGEVAHVAAGYLWQIGRKDEAVSRLAALHQANLRDSQARARYAQVLHLSGKSEQADALWEQGYAMNPKDPVIMAGHAATLASHGQYAEATSILQALIAAERRSVPGHSLLASIYQAQGKYEQARQQWDEVLQADRDNYRARMSLVQLQLAGGLCRCGG
jgi:Flp pilus assembly protein TadD